MTSALAENATQALSVAGNATSATNGTAIGTATFGADAAASVPPPVVFSWFGYFEAIAVMFLLLAALWGLLWLARRYGKFRFLPAPGSFPQDALRIEAQLPLGPRRGVYVIRYLDERLLIGVTEQHITLLQESSLGEPSHGESSRTAALCNAHPDAQRFARLMEQEHDALGEQERSNPPKTAFPPDRHDK